MVLEVEGEAFALPRDAGADGTGVEVVGAGGDNKAEAADAAAASAAAEFEGSGGTPDDVGVSPPITFGSIFPRGSCRGFRGDHNNRDSGGLGFAATVFLFSLHGHSNGRGTVRVVLQGSTYLYLVPLQVTSTEILDDDNLDARLTL
jgi:hypothetical protein